MRGDGSVERNFAEHLAFKVQLRECADAGVAARVGHIQRVFLFVIGERAVVAVFQRRDRLPYSAVGGLGAQLAFAAKSDDQDALALTIERDPAGRVQIRRSDRWFDNRRDLVVKRHQRPAAQRVKARNMPVQSWFLDLSLLMGYWQGEGARTYHHTAPVNAMYGLHESLLMLHDEGLENAWQRHRDMHELLVSGLTSLGLEFVVDASYRLPQLNVVAAPEGVNEADVRRRLLADFNLEIGAGLGIFAGKVWRIGLMGYAARRENVALCVSGLSHCL